MTSSSSSSSFPDDLLIIYMTQTGNSQSIAELFADKDLIGIVSNPRVYSAEQYIKIDKDLSLFAKERYVIFIVSTTGQGDVPDKSLPFYRILKRKERALPKDNNNDRTTLPFYGVNMINLGLGDTNYDKYNGAIKQIEKSLCMLGCEKYIPTVLADDGTGLEVKVELWRQQTRDILLKLKNGGSASDSVTSDQVVPVAESNSIPVDTTIKHDSNDISSPDDDNTDSFDIPSQHSHETVPCKECIPPTSSLLDRVVNISIPKEYTITRTSQLLTSLSVTKPPFLLKAQQPRFSSWLLSHDITHDIVVNYTKHNEPSLSDIYNKIKSKYKLIDHKHDISSISLSLHHIDDVINLNNTNTSSTPKSSYLPSILSQCEPAATTNSGLLIGNTYLLDQYMASLHLNNKILSLYDKLQQSSCDIPDHTKDEYKQLSILLETLDERGYGENSTMPLFGIMSSRPIVKSTTQPKTGLGLKTTANDDTMATTTDQPPGVKDIYEVEYTLDQYTATSLSLLNQYQLYNNNNNNNNNNTNDSNIPLRSLLSSSQYTTLYSPGDCVSVMVPSNHNVIDNLINTMGLTDFAHHHIILGKTSSTSTSVSVSSTSSTSSSPELITTASLTAQSSTNSNSNLTNTLTIPYNLEPITTHSHIPQPHGSILSYIAHTLSQTPHNAQCHQDSTTLHTTHTLSSLLLPSSSSSSSSNSSVIARSDVSSLSSLSSSSTTTAIPLTFYDLITPSLYTILSQYIDLHSPIKKSLIRALADCYISKSNSSSSTTDNTDNIDIDKKIIETLYELSSKDGKDKLAYIDSLKLTLSEFITLFSNNTTTNNTSTGSGIVPTLDILLDLLSSMKPRSYSINTSPLAQITIHRQQPSSSESSSGSGSGSGFGSSSSQYNQLSLTHEHDAIPYMDTILPYIPSIIQQHTHSSNDQSSLSLPSSAITSPVPPPQHTHVIAGHHVRFAATRVTDPLPSINNIPYAQYPGSTLHNIIQKEKQDGIIRDAKVSSLSKVLPSSTSTSTSTPSILSNERYHYGIATHWYQDLCISIKQLREEIFINREQYISYILHNNIFNNGIIIYKPSTNYQNNHDIIVLLPLFYHKSPNFHLPSITTATTTKSSSNTTNIDNTTTTLTKTDSTTTTTTIATTTPSIVMIGPGTGSSPFLSYIQHTTLLQALYQVYKKRISIPSFNRVLLGKLLSSCIGPYTGPRCTMHQPSPLPLALNHHIYLSSVLPSSEWSLYGPLHLYTGNRYYKHDYLYNQAFLSLLDHATPSLSSINSIFSRDCQDKGTDSSPIKYVQDMLNIPLLQVNMIKHIFNGGYIYICGDGTTMCKQVQNAIENALICQGIHYADKYTLQYDIDTTTTTSATNDNTTYTTLRTNESVNPMLVRCVEECSTYVQQHIPTKMDLNTPITNKNILPSFTTDDPAINKLVTNWAKSIIAIMIKSGRYNTDVW